MEMKRNRKKGDDCKRLLKRKRNNILSRILRFRKLVASDVNSGSTTFFPCPIWLSCKNVLFSQEVILYSFGKSSDTNMSDSLKTNVGNNSVDSSDGTRTTLDSPSLVRHKSSTSLNMPIDGRKRRAYTRTSTSAKLISKPNQIQIPIEIQKRKQQDLYLSLRGIGFDDNIASEAALRCNTFAEAISYKNNHPTNRKKRPTLTRASFRGKRLNTSKSVQKLRSKQALRPHILDSVLQMEEPTVTFGPEETIQEGLSIEEENKFDDKVNNTFVGIEEGMDLSSEYVNGVYELRDLYGNISGGTASSLMIKFVAPELTLKYKKHADSSNNVYAINHTVQIPKKKSIAFKEFVWKPTHSNHNGIDFIGYYDIKICDKQTEYHGHLYIPGYLTCDPASKVISLSRSCERTFRAFILVSLKAFQMDVSLAMIKELWMKKFIPYITQTYHCLVMAHWVLHQIIYIFDDACDNIPLSYAMFIKASIEYERNASHNNKNENAAPGKHYEGDYIFTLVGKFLNEHVEYVRENEVANSKAEIEMNNARGSNLQRRNSSDIIHDFNENYIVKDAKFSHLKEFLTLLERREERPPNRYYEQTCKELYETYVGKKKQSDSYWGNHRRAFSNSLGQLLFKVIQSSTKNTTYTYHLQCICRTWCKSLVKKEHEQRNKITIDTFKDSGFRFIDIPIVVEETQLVNSNSSNSSSIAIESTDNEAVVNVYKSYSTALILCLKLQNIHFVDILLKEYRDFDGHFITFSSPNFVDNTGMTALHHACIWGNQNIMDRLLSYNQGWEMEEFGYAHQDIRVYHVGCDPNILAVCKFYSSKK
jgi:hypothetical protein